VELQVNNREDTGVEYLKAYMDYRDILRRLAIGDASFFKATLCEERNGASVSALDPKAAAFARLGALVATGTSASGYQSDVDAAFASGVTMDEIVRVLVAVWPTVGLAKVMMAAPALGLAAGYDTLAALEQLEAP
jgi:alkylhydroperoxidase/carboxymuconolactone decarboxylase family protein YurZ